MMSQNAKGALGLFSRRIAIYSQVKEITSYENGKNYAILKGGQGYVKKNTHKAGFRREKLLEAE